MSYLEQVGGVDHRGDGKSDNTLCGSIASKTAVQHVLSRRILTTVALASTLLASGCSVFEREGSRSDDSDLSLIKTSASSDSIDNSRLDPRFKKQVYAATGLGLSRLEPDTSEVQGWDVDDRVNAGGQITIGADVNKRFSLELHSADLGSAGLSPGGRINYHLHGGSALIYAGKNRHRYGRQGLTGYGRIGVGMLENSPVGDVLFQKDNSTHVLFGAGVEYATRIGLGVRAEIISYEEDVQYGQLGLIYRLGRQREREPVFVAAEPETPVVTEPVVAAASTVPQTCNGFNGLVEGVNFHHDSDLLTNDATGVLDEVAVVLADCETAAVKVAAHTDSVGTRDYNQALSERRSKSVLEYLVKRGIERKRMQATAFGEMQPAVSNETRESRAKNRRVELFVD